MMRVFYDEHADPAALVELHGSGELGQVLQAAAREGLYNMIQSHASPACQAGIARHWTDAIGDEAAMKERIGGVLDAIREGTFARYLLDEQQRNYPELTTWRQTRPSALIEAERRVHRLLRGPRPKAAESAGTTR